MTGPDLDRIRSHLIPYGQYIKPADAEDSQQHLPGAEVLLAVAQEVLVPILVGIASAAGYDGLKEKTGAGDPDNEELKQWIDRLERQEVQLSEANRQSIAEQISDILIRSGLPRRHADSAANEILEDYL